MDFWLLRSHYEDEARDLWILVRMLLNWASGAYLESKRVTTLPTALLFISAGLLLHFSSNRWTTIHLWFLIISLPADCGLPSRWNFTNHVITSLAANHSAAVEAAELCSLKKTAPQIFVRPVVHAGSIGCVAGSVCYNQVIETYVWDTALYNRYRWYHRPDVVTSFIMCRCRRFSSPNR